jgi:putative chitinase
MQDGQMITESLLAKFRAAPGWAEALQTAADRFEINTKLRVAAWLANLLHESNGLRRTEESFAYSRKRLLEVFGKYFTASNVDSYLGFPRKIAARVYANRMGNGPESSWDGWTFRGGGPPQLTGRNNYALCGAALDMDLVGNPDVVRRSKDVGALAAGWFWHANDLAKFADVGDFDVVCQRWNGSSRPWGMAERQEYYDQLLRELT